MTNQWPSKIDKCMKAYLFNKCLQDLGICLSGSSGSFRFGLVGMFLFFPILNLQIFNLYLFSQLIACKNI